MNPTLELIMRTIAIFLGTFFTSRWFMKNKASLSLFVLAFVIGMVLNHYGPLAL